MRVYTGRAVAKSLPENFSSRRKATNDLRDAARESPFPFLRAKLCVCAYIHIVFHLTYSRAAECALMQVMHKRAVI